jgi:hypothetical protein
MKRVKMTLIVMAMALLAGTTTYAQELNFKQMAAKMRQNQEELRKYTWETKMTFLINDVQHRVDTYTVRFVMGGMVEKMQINSEVAKGKVVGADGKKLKKKELEAAREFVLQVKDQLDGYLNPMFAEKAVATSRVLSHDANLLLVSRDVMTTGDSVEITYHKATQTPVSAAIKTSVDGEPVSLEITFGSIEYGPNYTAGSTTISNWKGLKLTILTENSNYERGR